jgi:6-phosphogluconate dehydrogenase
MQIGLIGLGKMGYNLALNFKRNQYKVIAFDINKMAMEKIVTEGIATSHSISELTHALLVRRVIWIMVPAGNTIDVILSNLKNHLSPDDIVIDGGNSHFKDTIRRARDMEKIGVHFLDCGTSGGIMGALNGVCTMVGGKKEVFDYCEPIFKSISVQDGYMHCGASGSGHLMKMVHNGIESGIMQSIAEGMEILHKYKPDMDLAKVAHLWNHGSIIQSFLMELTENALNKNKNVESVKGVMNASAEGKWTVEAAIEMGVPTPVITLALMMRLRAAQEESFASKVVAAVRNEFGAQNVIRKEARLKVTHSVGLN